MIEQNNWVVARKQIEIMRRRFFFRRLAKVGVLVTVLIFMFGFIFVFAVFAGTKLSH